jgi:hypothetical protein
VVPSLKHVVHGGEYGSGDSHDCLLCSAARLDAVELGAQIAALLVHSGPGGLDQCRLQPGRTFAQAIGATLARTLVVARTDAGPGDEMAGGGEAAHLEPDLGEDHLRSSLGCRSEARRLDAHTDGKPAGVLQCNSLSRCGLREKRVVNLE